MAQDGEDMMLYLLLHQRYQQSSQGFLIVMAQHGSEYLHKSCLTGKAPLFSRGNLLHMGLSRHGGK